jgi:hypothetical protein
MTGAAELAAAAVALLATKAVEAVGVEAGKRLIGDLWDKVKAKLTGRDALAGFEASPDDLDGQATLRLQLKKALEADPAFKEEVAKLVGEIQTKGGDTINKLIAEVTGDHNATTQIVGSSNVVK